MTRKSAQQRYDEMKTLRDSYSSFEKEFFSWDIKFMSAMMEKIYFKKPLTKSMRDKIDELLETGKKSVPEKTPRILQLEQAIEGSGPREQEILKSFISRLLKGWTLSEKQNQLADKLVGQANRAPWVPSAQQEKDIDILIEVSRTYDRMWFGNNPSAERVISKLQQYKIGTGRIYENDLEFAKKKFAGGYRKMVEPKFQVGDKAYIYNGHLGEKKFCLIIEGPCVKGRHIVYDIMVDGLIATHPVDSLNKR